MEDKSKIAVEYFKSGYNCAQAVFLAYAVDYGMDREVALKLASSFGGGMGRLREVCGAVSAMFAVAGLECGYTSNNNDEEKAKHYALIQKLAQEFKNEYKTIICRELLDLGDTVISSIPTKRTDEFYQKRPCALFIEKACKILSENL